MKLYTPYSVNGDEILDCDGWLVATVENADEASEIVRRLNRHQSVCECLMDAFCAGFKPDWADCVNAEGRNALEGLMSDLLWVIRSQDTDEV
jgi:hypothetical protein